MLLKLSLHVLHKYIFSKFWICLKDFRFLWFSEVVQPSKSKHIGGLITDKLTRF